MQSTRKALLAFSLFLVYTLLTMAGWKEPKPVLQLNYSKEICNLSESGFFPINFQLQAIDKDGNFIFLNWDRSPPSVTILSPKGELIRHIPYPMLFEEKFFRYRWPFKVHVLGDTKRLLVYSEMAHSQECVFDYEGRLLNVIYNNAPRYNIYIYPDGKFVMFFRDESTKKTFQAKSDCSKFTFLLYSPDGELLEILNKRPEFLACTNSIGSEGNYQLEILFPDRRYLVPYEGGKRLSNSWGHFIHDPVRDRSGGFFATLFDGYSSYQNIDALSRADSQGRIIGEMDGGVWVELGHGKNNFYKYGPAVIDQQYNLFSTAKSDDGFFIYKCDWVDEPVTSPPLKMEPLDGWYQPLGAPLKTKCPQTLKTEAGIELDFHFPNQEIPLCEAPHPVYSLWQYQLSLYQEQNPGAILGTMPSNYVLWNSTVDFSQFTQGRISALENRGGKTKSSTYSSAKCVWATGDEGLPDCYECYDGKAETMLRTYWYNKQIVFNPDKPDIIRAKPWGFTGNQDHMFLYETGKDTKVFINPRIWTGLRLTPKNLDEGKAASILVHTRIWPDKKDTLTLRETAPGSRRFTNTDGTVIYELTFVMDEQKNLVARPDQDTINYLYFFITDPSLGLDHAPQIVGEQGVDKGEYRAWWEPAWDNINIGKGAGGPWTCKPWRQVEREIKQAQFVVKVSGPGVKAGSILRVTWDEPGKGPEHADIPLAGNEKDGFKTTKPLLCFTLTGCDIDNTWDDSDSVPTPQIPGAITFRDKNVKWEVVGQ